MAGRALGLPLRRSTCAAGAGAACGRAREPTDLKQSRRPRSQRRSPRQRADRRTPKQRAAACGRARAARPLGTGFPRNSAAARAWWQAARPRRRAQERRGAPRRAVGGRRARYPTRPPKSKRLPSRRAGRPPRGWRRARGGAAWSAKCEKPVAAAGAEALAALPKGEAMANCDGRNADGRKSLAADVRDCEPKTATEYVVIVVADAMHVCVCSVFVIGCTCLSVAGGVVCCVFRSIGVIVMCVACVCVSRCCTLDCMMLFVFLPHESIKRPPPALTPGGPRQSTVAPRNDADKCVQALAGLAATDAH